MRKYGHQRAGATLAAIVNEKNFITRDRGLPRSRFDRFDSPHDIPALVVARHHAGDAYATIHLRPQRRAYTYQQMSIPPTEDCRAATGWILNCREFAPFRASDGVF